MADPIDSIQWLSTADVHPNPWNPNRVHRPELRLLERSLLLTGWIQPLLVAPNPTGGYMLIDGFHRWRLAQDSKAVQARDGGLVPCAVLDLDRPSAMLLTVRINRAKGSHAAVQMSRLVRDLVEQGVPRHRIREEMGATDAEIDLLCADDVFAARGAAGWAYSDSWYPIEDGRKASTVAAERKATDPLPLHKNPAAADHYPHH